MIKLFTRARTFKVGDDSVYAHEFKGLRKWNHMTVTEVTGPLLYHVKDPHQSFKVSKQL